MFVDEIEQDLSVCLKHKVSDKSRQLWPLMMMDCDVQITDRTATTYRYINSPKFIEFIPIVTRNSSFGIQTHDDVIKWIHFPRKWPFVRGIHRSAENSPHKGQWRGALMFSLNCVWLNGWVNNREAGDLRRYRTHYDVTVMWLGISLLC